MNKIQQFLYSEDKAGNKFIIHTREPLSIFYLDASNNRFTLLSSAAGDPDKRMEGLSKRVNDWYIYSQIVAKK